MPSSSCRAGARSVRVRLLAMLFLLTLPTARAGDLLPDGDAAVDRLVLQGSLAEMQGDLGQATTSYRRALELPGAPAVAGRALFRLGALQGSDEIQDAAGSWLARHDPAARETGAWLDRLYARGLKPELARELEQLPDTLSEHLRIQLLLEGLADRPESGEKRRGAELERRLADLLRLDAAAWSRRGLRPGLFWEQSLAFGLQAGKADVVAAWIDSSRLARDEPAAWLTSCRLAAFREDLVGLRRAMARGRALDSLEAFYPLMAGRLALADDEPEQALAELREARRLDSQDTGILSLLAVALEETGRVDEAESSLRVLLATEPGEEQHWIQMASLLERQGRRREALALYARALSQLDGGAGPLLKNNYAYGLAVAGERLAEALPLARDAVAEAPDNPAYRDTLGWLYYLMGNYAEADEELQRAYDFCRGDLDPEILVHLGELRQRQGRVEEAAALWGKALELRPDDLELKNRLQGLRSGRAKEDGPHTAPDSGHEGERTRP